MATKNITLKKLGKRFVATILAVAMIVSTITIQSANNIVGAEETAKSTDGYVIKNTSNKTINVVINHMLENREIYRSDNKNIAGYGQINNYKKASNYEIKNVVDNKTNRAISNINEIEINEDVNLTVNYTTKVKQYNGSTTMYDYLVKPVTKSGKNEIEYPEGSINTSANYPTDSVKTNRFSIGTNGQNYEDNQYITEINNRNINAYKAGNTADAYKLGIIKGLSEDYKDVIFSVDEPGVFSNDKKIGKEILDGYQLQFDQSGDNYILRKVLDPDGKVAADNMSAFFPLDNASSNVKDNGYGSAHNYFFGMRYDIEFKLGDYVGDLNYSFTGDDDLWVLLDGEVVLDIGGIHDALSGDVNLWDVLEKRGITKNSLANNENQREEKHRLTILYMERGGNLSNCNMNFTLPDAYLVDVSNAPKASITINKVSSEDNSVKLPNANFTLTRDGTNDSRNLVTKSNGQLVIENLIAGTYTLTETSAPDGYQVTETTYKIIVENAGDDYAIAKLYKEDGTTVIGDNTITNTPNRKIIEDILDYNKSAKLSSKENAWDNREYQITINASSNKEEASTVTKGTADIMLVLDRSGSMGDEYYNYDKIGNYNSVKNTLNTKESNYYYEYDGQKYQMRYKNNKWQYYRKSSWRDINNNSTANVYLRSEKTYMDDLKLAANSFVNSLATNTPNSMVGVSSFSSDGYGGGAHDVPIKKIGSDASSYTTKISALEANGGTSPNLGLDYAISDLQKLRNNNSENKQYVILFTDGAPTGNRLDPDANKVSHWDSKRDTEASIAKLKAAGVIVYTIGFNISNNTNATNWLKNTVASDAAHAKSAENLDDLYDVFKEIESEVSSGSAIAGVTIQDTIDSRFTITEDEELRLEGTGATVTYNNDGTITVKWDNQEIPYGDNGKYEWSKTINVVAKDEFIGGNNVSTNVPGEDNSYIEIPDLGKVELQEPKVNVKLDFVVNNVNEVLFKGETFTNSEDMIKKLFDSSAVTNSKGTAITMYDPSAFSTQLYKADVNGDKTLETVDVGESFTTNDARYLDVTYNPGVASDSATANTEGHTAQENNDNVKTGKLDVKFVAGRLAITKTINSQYADKFTASKTNATQTFVFKIDQYKDSTKAEKVRTFYETITFNANEDDTEKTKYVSELEKGYYVVTEETSWSSKYSIDDSTAKVQEFDIGNTESIDDNGKKTFTGLDDNENCKYTELADGTAAGFSFKNILKPWANWYSDAATAKNKFNK